MTTICKNCIYGGIGVFSKAIKKYKDKIIEINYNNNGYGCRLTVFKSKEDVCLNNNFSEYRSA